MNGCEAMKKIKEWKANGKMNSRYVLTFAELDEIWECSSNKYDATYNSFVFGYIRGHQAATNEMKKEVLNTQEEHREVSSREGIVREFLEREVPEDWSKWSLDKRRMFWAGAMLDNITLVPRDRACALEVWCEALGGNLKEMKNADTREINAIIAAMPEWKKSAKALHFGPYGTQRGFTPK